MKAYTAKSSAIRAAKASFGTEWQSKAAIAQTDAGWQVLEAELKDNVTLTEALAESGQSIEELKEDDGHMIEADKAANRALLGWKLSTVVKPTKLVHEIAYSMPNASRKEVIAECIARGIGAGTARTQYQAYFSARKADEARRAQKEQA